MADEKYSIPGQVGAYLEKLGYEVPWSSMSGHVARWDAWMRGRGDFYDYEDYDADGNLYKVHRRSIRPAKRVCREWSSLLMDEHTSVQCESQECNEWLEGYLASINFWSRGQGLVQRAFGLGTGAWALWVDTEEPKILPRRYFASMTIPVSWDEDGVTECAFATRVHIKGKPYDQLQMHLIGEDGTYDIHTVYLDDAGREVEMEGVIPVLETGCPTPTFAIVKPAIENTMEEFSPYGMSVFEDAIDVIQSVDIAYDAIFTEVDVGKIRVFLSDMLLERDEGEGGSRVIPFGKEDCTVFRKVGSAEDMVQEFAPALRTEAQVKAYRTALQTLGDQCGFGLGYFDIDEKGGIKTATEVSSDNSQLMRSIKEHEKVLGDAIAQISRALLHCARKYLGESLPPEGNVTVSFDDSIIQDTAAEKAQDLAELDLTLNDWEYRMKWYNEDEETARANVPRAAAQAAGGHEGEGVFPAGDEEAEE
ncbi:hypothetical protein AALA69_03245 [Eggerthellaceae bacterium 24-137]